MPYATQQTAMKYVPNYYLSSVNNNNNSTQEIIFEEDDEDLANGSSKGVSAMGNYKIDNKNVIQICAQIFLL